MASRFQGLVAAPFTPFHPDRSLNLEVIPAYAKLLRENGVATVFVCGTTGEGPSLTAEERLAVAERWIASADEGLRVIVHVGSSSVGDAQRFAVHAAKHGASAIGCFPPYFFRSNEIQDLVDWCEMVAAAGSPLPFYYYHIPSMTGTALSVARFLEAAAPRIPTLAGVKYTHEDLDDYQACATALGGRFDCLFGRDELLLEGLGLGARGAVGSTYNYAAPLYYKIIDCFQRGNLAQARKLQDQSIEMIQICANAGVSHLAAGKQLMAWLGVDCGPVRHPLRQPTPVQISSIREKLSALGFEAYACK